jgi:hypothetical protein
MAEYSTLLVIHKQWQLGRSASAIASYLTSQKICTRMHKEWSRNGILNIIERFENKSIVMEGGLL